MPWLLRATGGRLQIAVTLFVVAALATLRPERVDAYLMLSVFVVHSIYPSPFIRFAATFVLLVFRSTCSLPADTLSGRCSYPASAGNESDVVTGPACRANLCTLM